MKEIFDYPQNEDTQYIDPLYVGGSSAGFFKRVDDLKDGNYRAWNATAPVETVNDLMENFSKFADYFDYMAGNDLVSMEAFYQYPLVVAHKSLIGAETATAADVDSTAVTITHSTGEFTTGDKMVLNNFNNWLGDFEDYDVFYANVVDAENTQLRVGSPTGPFLRVYNLEDAIDITGATAADPCVFTDSTHDLTTGTLVKMTEFDGDLALWNGSEFYAQVIDSSTFNLSFDSAGTDLLRFTTIEDTPVTAWNLSDNEVAVNFTVPGGTVVRDKSSLYTNTAPRAKRDGFTPPTPQSSGDSWAFDSTGKIGQSIERVSTVDGYVFTINRSTYDGTTEEFVSDFSGVQFTSSTDYHDWHFSDDLSRAVVQYGDRGIALLEFDSATNTYTSIKGILLGEYMDQYATGLAISADGQVVYATSRIFTSSYVHRFTNDLQTEQTFRLPYPKSFDLTTSVLHTNNIGDAVLFDTRGPVDYMSGSSDRYIEYYLFDSTGETKVDEIDYDDTKPISVNRNLRRLMLNFNRYFLSDGINLVEAVDSDLASLTHTAISDNEMVLIKDDAVEIYEIESGVSTSTRVQTFTLTDDARTVILPNKNIRGFVHISHGTSPYADVLVRRSFETIMEYIKTIDPLYIKTHDTLSGYWTLYNDFALTSVFDWSTIDDDFSTTYYATSTTVDIDPELTDSTTGDVREVKTADDIGQILLTDPAASTTGEIAIAGDDPYRYEITSVDLMTNGNQIYKHLTAEDTYTFAAEVDDEKYYEAFASFPVYIRDPRYVAGRGETMPDFNVTVDSNGYLDTVTLVDGAGPEGKFANNRDICLFIKAPADTYTPAALSPAQQQDVYDTADEWADTGYDAAKVWPSTVSPRRVNWIHELNSSVTTSMNGKKYVRSSGYQKMQLEVTYPPLTSTQFAEMAAFAQAMQGQVHPVNFPLLMDNGKYLLSVENAPYNFGNRYVLEDAAAGSSIVHLHGYASQEEALVAGEMIRLHGGVHGGLYTVVNTATANMYGEVKARLSHPLTQNVSAGDPVNHRPERVTVSLAEDGFQYTQRLDGFYDLTVTFDTDEWK